MKYKVGDKVRVRKDLEVGGFYGNSFVDLMEKNIGKIVTIKEAHGDNNYRIKENGFWWTDEMFEPIEYTYEDLCKAPVGTKITFENKDVFIKTNDNMWKADGGRYRKNYDLKKFKDGYDVNKIIIKIEEPSYTTVYEAKDILDDKEREYLSNVIKPFKDKVMCIIKRDNLTDSACEYIEFKVRVNQNFSLPNFKKGTMYKGMEADREYSLEELELM